MSHPITYVDSVQVADGTDHADGSTLPDAFQLCITIPADRRDDVDRNDTSRRELTAIIEEAIAAHEAG
jgi:hypothetical protein